MVSRFEFVMAGVPSIPWHYESEVAELRKKNKQNGEFVVFKRSTKVICKTTKQKPQKKTQVADITIVDVD